jgi:hypothetical protein
VQIRKEKTSRVSEEAVTHHFSLLPWSEWASLFVCFLKPKVLGVERPMDFPSWLCMLASTVQEKLKNTW